MDNLKELNQLTKKLQKEYGVGVVMNLANGEQPVPIRRFPVSSPKIGDLLGGGGTPQGRIIEIYGPESVGKTSLACYLAGQLQNTDVMVNDTKGELNTRKGTVVYIDAENSIDPDYALIQGFDVKKSILVQPDSGEQALDIAIAYASSGLVDMIVIDSIAALAPLAELEGAMTDQQMGAQARMLSKFLRKASTILAKNNCTIICINQLRQKIGVMWGSNETTAGGNALKFYASIRIDVRKVELIMEKDKAIGLRSRVKTVKNKTAVPMKVYEIDFFFDRGIDSYLEWIDFAISGAIIKQSGAWFTLPSLPDKKFQGKNAVMEYYLDPEHKKEYDEVVELVKVSVFGGFQKFDEVIREVGEVPNFVDREEVEEQPY